MIPRVSGLNHLTLQVGDLDRSLAFYRDLLGCMLRARWANGAYLDAGSLWLCLSVGAVSPREDYTHAAFSVSEGGFADRGAKLGQTGLEGQFSRGDLGSSAVVGWGGQQCE